MFGGVGLYRDSLMFGLVTGGQIFLKSDGETGALFRAAGSRPFAFERQGKTVETSYFSLPSEALDDSDALKLWAGRAFDAAVRSSTKPKKRKMRAKP